MSQNQHNSL